jgi:hypothetical protein
MKKGLWVAIVSTLILSAGFVAAAEKKTGMAKMPEHQMYAPADMKWMDAPPVLPPGAKAALLEGDPHKAAYFAMRLKFPDGYKIMPHWHPNVERLTVISGTLGVGVGDTFDENKGHEMTVGTYATMQPKVHHFAWAKGETEIQLTTIGPWKLVYVDPKDDPSKMAKK